VPKDRNHSDINGAAPRLSLRADSGVAFRLHPGQARERARRSERECVCDVPATPLRVETPAGRSTAGRLATEGLAASDARWDLAKLAAFEIAGTGTGSGGLSASGRTRLLARAKALGLRVFDASLVLAVMQDAARRGEGALSPEVQSRLLLIGPARGIEPDRDTNARAKVVLIASWSVVLGLAAAFGVVKWLVGNA